MKTNTNFKTGAFKSLCLGGICALAVVANGADFTSSTVIPTFPGGSFGVPLTVGGELTATGGDVSVTYLGYGGASFDEFLFVQTPGGNNLNLTMAPNSPVYTPFTYGPTSFGGQELIDNQTTPAGYTVNLGAFPAGSEVEFGIHVFNTGNTWYDGSGSRNADGAVHAYTVNGFNYTINSGPNDGQTGSGTYVGFEDEAYPGGDFNYADLQFSFSGVVGTGEPGQPSVPDAGTTMSLLGLGLSGLAAFGRRFRK